MHAELAERALGWILSHLPCFRLGEPGDQAERIVRVKRIGEIALLASALPTSLGRTLFEWAWRELDEGRELAALVPVAPPIGVAYLPLRRAGFRSREVELALADPACRSEAPTWHRFTRYALGVALEAVGVSPPWSQDALRGHLDLIQRPQPGDSPLRAEAMAHLIMWHTELGRAPHALGKAERDRLAAAVEPWCALLVSLGEHDALIEILIAARCVRLPTPTWAWAALHAAQRDDGAIPQRRDATGTSFEELYHATLVAVVAGNVGVQPATAGVEPYANFAE